MTSGGSRVRSGPPADPKSGRSEKRGVRSAPSGIVLPNREFDGEVPKFPLPQVRLSDDETGARSRALRRREMALWRQHWKSPQAFQWAKEPWRWGVVAQFCRLEATTEASPGASASLLSRQREWRNEIGLSPDGLKHNGWSIAEDEVGAKRDELSDAGSVGDQPPAPVRRLRS